MQPIVTYLRNGVLPLDKAEAKKLQLKAVRYVIIDDTLYKRSYSLPLLRCVGPNEAEYLLKEIHEGTCADHVGATMLALKILRQGYFWPSMKMDALTFVRKCEKCQMHAKIQHVPSAELTPLSSPWPFAQGGIDLMGPFPPASGQRKSVVVAIDYFTKWVEAKALAKTTAADVKDFLWKQVICRFGLPKVIISDGGPPFKSVQFKDFLSDMNIQHRVVSVAYPQSRTEEET